MAIKFNLPKKDIKTGNSSIASTGGYNKSASSNKNSAYVGSSTANMPVTKNAQMAGSGASVIWTQPMFFSPLHTPQNWQIASKRREVYQWLITDCDIMTYDYTYKNISEIDLSSCNIIEDTLTGGLIYEGSDIEPIMNSEGEFSKPPRFSERECSDKRTFSFMGTGYWRKFSISEEHNIFVLDGKTYRHKLKIENNAEYRRKQGIEPNGVVKVNIPDKMIKRIRADEIQIDDYLLSPVPGLGNTSIGSGLAWLIGVCIADGTISPTSNNYSGSHYVRFTCNKNDKHVEQIEKELSTNFTGKIGSVQHGDGDGWRINSSTTISHNFFRDYIINKLSYKKFTTKVFDLDKESRLHVIGGYFDGDGSFSKQKRLVANNYSKDMADQLYSLLLSCGIVCSLKRLPLYGDHYPTSSEWCYRIAIPSSEVPKLQPYMRSDKIPVDFVPKKQRELRFFYEEDGVNYIVSPIAKIEQFYYTGKGYDIEMTNDRHAFVASGFVCSNCRFYYDNEPKVAAGVDFYCFDPDTQILMSDGEQKAISSITEGDLVRSHDGTSNVVLKVHQRETKEQMLSISISGISQGPLNVTENHSIFIMKDGNVIEIIAKDLKIGDEVLTPCLYDENKFSKTNIDCDLAWLVGVYSAEGCGIPYEHTSKKGRLERHYKGVYFSLSESESETLALEIISRITKIYGNGRTTLRVIPEKGITIVSAYGTDIADDLCGLCPGIAKDGSKRLAPFIMGLSKECIKNILAGFMSGDGCFNKNNGFQGVGVSKKLSEQIANMCDRLGLEYSFTKTRISTENRQTCYNVRISRRACSLFDGLSYKFTESDIDENFARNIPYRTVGKFIVRKIRSIKTYYYEGKVYDLTVANAHSYVANRISVHNSIFPMNGFTLECKNKKVLKYFEKISKRLRINYWLKLISHEYFLLGDVFPFLEISCPHCGGGGTLKTGEMCNHSGGTVKRIVVLNPDWIEVQTNVLANEPVVALVPDDELRMIVQRKQPKQIYDKLPKKLIELIASGMPISLSNRCVSHIKHNASPYGIYGTAMLRRLFTVLAYKTKLMTANWIVAERLILPVRVVKIGDKDRPASPEDISDVSSQLAAVANDPNLTLVTHHAFSYEWYGACYSDDTEVLTENGWKLFKDISHDEKVGTYNQETGYMEYEKPTKYYEYDFASNEFMKMYRFNHRSVDILVTPNHRMLVERNGKMMETYSQDIKHDDKFISTVNWMGEYPVEMPHMKSCLSHLPLHDYLEFAGYYISEGGAKEERNRGLSESKIIQACSISQNKSGKYYNDIRTSVALVYPNFSEYEDKRNSGCSYMTINSVDIARYLSEEFGSHSHNKRIPKWIKDLPKHRLEIILKSLLKGDGGTRGRESLSRYTYTTTSKQLADDVSEICLKLGYFTTIGEEEPKNGNCRKVYKVYWSENRKDIKFNIRKKNITQEEYSGKVYCVKVPNSWLVTRRNGRISVQGNSGKIQSINTELEYVGKEILDGLMLNQALLNGEMAGYSCYPLDTQVLTSNGFKNFDDVTEVDLVACYNPESQILEYHPYIARHEYDYNGELVQFLTDKIDIQVTPNHRMYAQQREEKEFSFIEAKDIRPRAKFIQSVSGFDGDYMESVKMGDEEVSIYDFCKLVGYFVSEGYASSSKYTNLSASYTVGICQNKNGKAYENINTVLTSTGKKFSKQADGGFKISNKKWYEFFCQFGHGAENKTIPSWIKNLSSECLELILEAAISGDGCSCKTSEKRKNTHHAYYTVSKQLALDIEEIAFKCGYTTSISFRKAEDIMKGKTKKYFNKLGHEFVSRKDMWIVNLSKGFKGKRPALDSRKIDRDKIITKVPYNGKVWCFTVPHGLFVTKRNDKITIQGNSAQVGVEVMIRRLDSWRHELSEWVENHIFLPIAMMQGFIDEEETEEMGETVYLTPTVEWNDLNLRDTSNVKQMFIALHDKKLISSQTLLDQFDVDYDQEIEKIREETIAVGAQGQMGAPGGGSPMGGMPPGGGGGAPGGPPPGAPPGGDMAGGAPMGGDMAGGAPAGGAPAGGAPMGATAGSTSMSPGFKISKRGKGKNPAEAAQDQQPQSIRISLTKLEQKMYKVLIGMGLPYKTYAQYKVAVAGQQQPFVIDFAMPEIGIGFECLHPDTIVQTTDGSKYAKDISIEDKLIGRTGDPVTINSKMVNVSDNLLKIKASGMLPMDVTKNHPILVSRPEKTRVYRNEPRITRTREYLQPGKQEWITASDIKTGDYLVIPKQRNISKTTKEFLSFAKYKAKAHNAHILPESIRMNSDFGWLMGIYAAEGSSTLQTKKPTSGSVEFSLNISETDIADKIQSILLNLFGLPSSVYVDINHNSRKVVCCCGLLATFFKENFGNQSTEKRLPNWMFESEKECKMSFLEAFCEGDGCIRTDGETEVSRHISSSVKMLVDIQALSFSMGIFATICQSRTAGKIGIFAGNNGEERRYATNGLWEMDIIYKGSSKKQYREDEQYFYVPVRKISSVKYNGPVINFETEKEGISNHTYLVNNMCTHNCDGAQWHEQAEAKAKDQQRDQKLAGLGWRILRFREKAIEDRMNEVQNIIAKNIETASKYRKKATADGTMIKEASINFENIDINDIVITKESMGDDLGDIFIIGVADNG